MNSNNATTQADQTATTSLCAVAESKNHFQYKVGQIRFPTFSLRNPNQTVLVTQEQAEAKCKQINEQGDLSDQDKLQQLEMVAEQFLSSACQDIFGIYYQVVHNGLVRATHYGAQALQCPNPTTRYVLYQAQNNKEYNVYYGHYF